jgi:hypothetical protein
MKRALLYLPFILVFFTGCNPVYYTPNSTNIPMLREKNEIQATGYFGGGAEASILGATGAYAITNSIGLMMNVTYFSDAPIDLESNTNTIDFENLNYNPISNSLHAEVGVGLFKGLFEEKHFIFETYAGYGIFSNNKVLNSTHSVSYLIHRPFIQPSISFRHKNFEAAYGLRIARINFSNQNPSTAFAQDSWAMSDYEKWNNHTRYEHNLTLRVGNEKIKLQAQWINPIYIVVLINEISPNFTLGIQLRL